MTYWIGKAVVVTGAVRGQGAAEVLHMLNLGAHVVAVDIHPATSPYWQQLHESSGTNSERLTSVVADIATTEGWDQVAATVTSTGVPLFGLVNNAGITLRKTVSATTPEEWERVLAVNLSGAFLGIHTLSPLFSTGASIVNISSTAGLSGYFGAAYSASKWALRGLTRSAAIEFASRDIRVNCVCPGLIETEMVNSPDPYVHGVDKMTFHDANQAATPLQRGADPGEVARTVSFLLGPESSFITGADLPVDGGFSGGGLYLGIGKATGNL
ncbi:MAG: SDR family NAD(P)-dependent oxidoreductase [Gulosibacter sp.]|uniref:SDR family NAD(P)-dependent oxidoreductase n=1 Tax=Gulosibacter sp. TaxID=2817531 RepID=UPI003F8F6F03